MKTAIRFTPEEELKALPILLRHSPGMVLRDHTYVIEQEAAAALCAAGVVFTEVSREAEAPCEEVASGERI